MNISRRNKQPLGQIPDRNVVNLHLRPLDDRLEKELYSKNMDKIIDTKNNALETTGKGFRSFLNLFSAVDSFPPTKNRNTNRRAGKTALVIATGIIALGAFGIHESSSSEQSNRDCAAVDYKELGVKDGDVGPAATKFANYFPESPDVFDTASEQLANNDEIVVCEGDTTYHIAKLLDQDQND